MEKGMFLLRKLHKLSRLEDKRIFKLFILYEGPYVVSDVYNNVGEIQMVTDSTRHKENMDNIKIY